MRNRSVFLLLLMLCLFISPVSAQTDGDFAYSIRDGKAIITAYTGSAGKLIVPDTLDNHPVTAINYCAFRNCASLEQITLPDGLLTIGSNAFQDCTSLEQIDLPDTLAFIGTHAFYGCAKLTQITLPESIERLHPYAFYGCSAVRRCSLMGRAALVLTDFGYSFICPEYPQLSLMAHEDDAGLRTFTVTDCDDSSVHVGLPAGTTLIDGYAFSHCASLTEITLPDSVTEISYSAFEGCSALTRVILSDNVVKIAENAFSLCPDITLIAPEGSAAQALAQNDPDDNVFWQIP